MAEDQDYAAGLRPMIDPLEGKRSIGESPAAKGMVDEVLKGLLEPFKQAGRVISGRSDNPVPEALLAGLGIAGTAPTSALKGVARKGAKAAEGLAEDAYAGIRGKYAHWGDEYPAVPPPVLSDKKTGKPIPAIRPDEGQGMVDEGKAYWAKGSSPATDAFMKDRTKVNRTMDEGYERYFDPAQRSNVDPASFPAGENMATAAQPKKAETRAQYEAEYDTPAARERLSHAFKVGQGEPSAVDWYAMRQLHDEFVKHLGPEEGPRQFARKFAGSMAATTGGSDPTSNLLMAAYVNHLDRGGHPFPTNAWQMPNPIGGRYAGSNVQQAKQFFAKPEERFGADNPKRSDFQHNFLGHTDRATIDEQMSGAIQPGMQQPKWYGPATKVVQELAKEHGVDPMNFQDVAWAGLKKLKVEEGGKKFEYEGPMIEHVNRAIHRTSVLTGKSQKDVVRDWITKDAPLYGLAGSLGGGALLEGEHARDKQ